MTTARDLALETLNRQEETPGYPERYLDLLFEKERGLSERDKALAVHLVQGVVRWKLRLDWIVKGCLKFSFKKIDPPVLNILRLALYQIFLMDRIPESAAVNEAVKQASVFGRHLSGFVNGLLRNICRNKERVTLPDRDEGLVAYLSIMYSYPEWLVEKWVEELGEHAAERLLEAQNRIPLMGVRVNRLKIDRRALIARLKNEGVTGSEMPYAPEGVLLSGLKGPITRLNAFREGLIQVQGEAAQIAVHLLAPRKGSEVLDLCAGLGGKTSHITELMDDQGSVIALDRSHERLVSLNETARRLGIRSVHPLAADAAGPLSNLFRRSFAKILLDAPCSGLGVLSRHPDGKWSKREEDIRRLAGLQKALLHAAVPLLKKGGEMLFVVCTISREENEGVVEEFLTGHTDMALLDLKGYAHEWAEPLIDERGFFRTLPHVHATEGFFGALFVKK